MSEATPQQLTSQQQKIIDFIRLLPLTQTLAGLPSAPPGTHFNEGQLEARATTLKTAYRVARQLIADITQ